MKSIPQFNSNDNLLTKLSSQTKSSHHLFKKQHITQYSLLSLLFISVFLISLIYFQIQISTLNKTIASLSPLSQRLDVNPVSSSQYNANANPNTNTYNPFNNLLDLKSSSIITSPDQMQFIHQLFGSFKDTFSLLYKATYFGDKYLNLKNVIYKSDHILIIIKTEKGEIIGGYSDKEINNAHSCLKLDSYFESFTFDVNEKKKNYPVHIWGDFCKGILCLSYDLVIEDNFMTSSDSYYDFSNKSLNYQHKDEDENHKKFKVKEMEIYKVVRIGLNENKGNANSNL